MNMDYLELLMGVGRIAGNLGHIQEMAKAAMANEFVQIVLLAFGLCNCFLGYRLMRFWFFLFGAALGGGLGYGLGISFLDDSNLALGTMVAGAVILGALAFFIYQAGIFLFCSVVGAAILTFVFRPNTSFLFFLCLLAGGVVGFLAVKFVRPIVIVTTSVQGGMSAGAALAGLLSWGKYPGIALGAGIALCGILVQWATTKGKKSVHREPKEASREKRASREFVREEEDDDFPEESYSREYDKKENDNLPQVALPEEWEKELWKEELERKNRKGK